MALGPQPPDIFKLNIDCFEELFESLSLSDLVALGKTCRTMQLVTGYYYRLAYSGSYVRCYPDSHHGILEVFSDFVENLLFDWLNFNYFCLRKSGFKSLKMITFQSIDLSEKSLLDYIKKFQNQVETIKLVDLRTVGDCYELFLRNCTNMKRLFVDQNISDAEYDWLCNHYPKLEYLALSIDKSYGRITQLTDFFTLNPGISHFATNHTLLLAHRETFVAANVKLHSLGIQCVDVDSIIIDDLRDLLNIFHQREVYKRLHLYTNEDPHQFAPMHTVEKLGLDYLQPLSFINLKEIYFYDIRNNINMEAVASSLINIELIYFGAAKSNTILPFIRRSRKLKHFGAWSKIFDDEKNIYAELDLWNKEREKLIGSKTVAIYVFADELSIIKRATQSVELRSIVFKRMNLFPWVGDFRRFAGFFANLG